MPAGNPMAEVLNFGGDVGGSAGPVSAKASGSASVDDHHVSATVLLLALGLLVLLWQNDFRFSMTVGGR